MLFSEPIDTWITLGAFIVALLAVLVTWALTTLGNAELHPQPPAVRGSALWDASRVAAGLGERTGRVAGKPVVFDDVLQCEPKLTGDMTVSDTGAVTPNIVEIEMELPHVEVEGPMPEELRELYAEDKHSSPAGKRRKLKRKAKPGAPLKAKTKRKAKR